MKERVNWNLLEHHLGAAVIALSDLYGVVKLRSDERPQGVADADVDIAEMFSDVYRHLNCAWNRRHDDETIGLKAENPERCPEEFDQCLRNFDVADKPIIEPSGERRHWPDLDYDAVDFSKESLGMEIPVLLGVKESGEPLVVDLARQANLLVGGLRDHGKSMFIETMLYGLLKRFAPDEIKLVLHDEMSCEFAAWTDSPYLMRPIVYKPNEAVEALKDLESEMTRRLDLFTGRLRRNINDYNASLGAGESPMPHIVFVSDEIAGMMDNERDAVLPSICQLASKGRSAGIHLILATDRMDDDVLPGRLLACLPRRLAFKLHNDVDSRKFVYVSGAQNLRGPGDMLFANGVDTPVRLHGPRIDIGRYYNAVEQSAM